MSELGSLIYDQNNNQSPKAQDGESIISGILIGTVTNNFNPLQRDKVEVEIPTGGEGSSIIVWAKYMSPAAGNDWGMYYVPEVGDKVVVSFVAGNVMRPFILGAVYQKKASMVSDCSTLLNAKKKIRTKGGSEISFENKLGKEVIEIKTKGSNKVMIDDVQNEITITGPMGKNIMKIDSQTGKVTIEAAAGISIKTGMSEVDMNANGTIEVGCRKLNVGKKANIKVDAAQFELDAATVDVKAAGTMKLDATGNMKINATGPMSIKANAILEASATLVKIN